MKILIFLCTLSLFGLTSASLWHKTEQELNETLEQVAVWKKDMNDVIDYHNKVYSQDILKEQRDSRISNIMKHKEKLAKTPKCNKTFSDVLKEQERLIDDLIFCAKADIKVNENLINAFRPRIEAFENKIIQLQNMKCGNLETEKEVSRCTNTVRDQLMVYKIRKFFDDLLPSFLSTSKILNVLKKPSNCLNIYNSGSDYNENKIVSCFKYPNRNPLWSWLFP